jgi:radical SAM superfamily enzyme YgiQ (UPF0313 family)
MSHEPSLKRFHVFLIKPSKYDDEGYVIRWARAVLVSNSLAVLNALTEDAARSRILGPEVEILPHVLDETVTQIRVKEIAASMRRAGDQCVICMVGVQSNQYPRAVDLGREFTACGLKTMIGGFHVSGSVEMLPQIPPEIQGAMDEGITIVAGEVEHRWNDLLREAYRGTLKPYYNFVDDKPALNNTPPPFTPRDRLQYYIPTRQSSFDAGRGCPFQCSFCTIINVQGRTMRGRTADDVEALIRRNYAQGIREFFITDDNFARHPDWESIIDRILELREKDHIHIRLMIQTDTMAHRIPRFIEKLGRAGCRRVFIGMESVNPENLKVSAKYHNRVNEYRAMLQAWRDQQVVTYAGYMIGFPGDTYESIMRDVEFLKRELPLDFVELFVATPLPGSKDHQQNFLKGIPMDEDLNKYDTTQPCMEHPKMSREELQKAYRDAWRSFYSRQHVETILKRRKDRRRRNVARQMLWFRSSFFIENVHPLLGGFFRLKGRRMRSPRFPVESIPTYYWRRTKEIALWSVRAAALLLEMRYIYHKVTRDEYRHYMDVAITPDPIGKRTTRRSDDHIVVEVPAPASRIQKHSEASDLKPDVAMPDVSYR